MDKLKHLVLSAAFILLKTIKSKLQLNVLNLMIVKEILSNNTTSNLKFKLL